jgi:hypothetical protein
LRTREYTITRYSFTLESEAVRDSEARYDGPLDGLVNLTGALRNSPVLSAGLVEVGGELVVLAGL